MVGLRKLAIGCFPHALMSGRNGENNRDEADVSGLCKIFSSWPMDHAENLKALLNRYDKNNEEKWNRPDQLKFTTHEGRLAKRKGDKSPLCSRFSTTIAKNCLP